MNSFSNQDTQPKQRSGLIAVGAATAIVFIMLVVTPLERWVGRRFGTSLQDSCAFGHVSNGRYRGLLALAKKSVATNWGPLSSDTHQMNVQISKRFYEFTDGMTDIPERIAALHALLRAHHAEFKTTDPDSETPFDSSKTNYVSFGYHMNANDQGHFVPIFSHRQIYVRFIFGSVRASTTIAEQVGPNTFDFFVRGAHYISGNVEIPRSALGDLCPRVPSVKWLERFEKRKQ